MANTAKHLEAVLYVEDGWTPDKIKVVLDAWPVVSKYAFILHDKDLDKNGNPKKPHYHVYLSFGNSSTSIQSVANHFGIKENQVSKIRSNRYLTLRYYLHIGTDKHQYPVDAMAANFDVQAFFDSKNAELQRKKVEELLENCAAGIITRANKNEKIPDVLYIRYRSLFEAAFALADERLLAAQTDRNILVIWICGKSGVGKTTLCKLVSDQQSLAVYVTANGNDPFSKYMDQPVIVLDELRPNAQYTYVDLLRILDPHTAAAVHCRFFDKVLKAKVIFVTSIYSPIEFYNALYLSKEESAVQLYRRIQEVWYMDKQSITISQYDMKTGSFVEKGTVNNPVQTYLAAQVAEKKNTVQIDSAALLGDIEKQYQTAAPAVLALPPASAEGEAAGDTEAENLPFPDASEQGNEMENLSLFDEAS